MSRLKIVVLMMLATAPLAWGAGSGGMSGGDAGSSSPAVRRTPQQMEASSYNAGLNHKKRAAQYEEKAATAKNDAERVKLLAKAKDQYLDAIDDYKKAIGYNNRSYQALNELGYAYRKSGDYQSAVRAYDAALIVKADFAPAIEYRGEAYLALGMFPQVQDAYLALFRADQDQAATLMNAMDAWVQQHPDHATPEAKAFTDWVVERKGLAAQTQSLSSNNTHDWN
jgi:tetratricopeptide (TPR) repeat protein